MHSKSGVLLDNFEQIESSRHIVIRTDNKHFALANVVYSYLLTLHKKISFVMSDEIEKKFVFLPWFDKVRSQMPSSFDLILDIDFSSVTLYRFFEENDCKLNTKMLTSFYAALIIEDEQDGFLLQEPQMLKMMTHFLEAGADFKTTLHYLKNSNPLSLFRLRSYMFGNFIQKEEAQLVEVYINAEILKKSGATLKDAHVIAKELLGLVHVNRVLLIEEEEQKIIEEIKEKN